MDTVAMWLWASPFLCALVSFLTEIWMRWIRGCVPAFSVYDLGSSSHQWDEGAQTSPSHDAGDFSKHLPSGGLQADGPGEESQRKHSFIRKLLREFLSLIKPPAARLSLPCLQKALLCEYITWENSNGHFKGERRKDRV